ncbi:MAG: tetratricopeptide repeat protein [Aridibacter famidurans]|nr:tetratricopeptide repeat protein [Aridibacter famidurans]
MKGAFVILLWSNLLITCSVGDTRNMVGGNYTEARNEVKEPEVVKCESSLSGSDHLQQAWGDLELGYLEAARIAFECAFSKGAGDFEDRLEHLKILVKLEDYSLAIEKSKQLLAEDPNNWVVHASLAHAYLKSNQFENALREIEVTRSLDPQNQNRVSYLFDRALALDGLNQRAEALDAYVEYCEHATKIEPNSQRYKDAKERINELKALQSK